MKIHYKSDLLHNFYKYNQKYSLFQKRQRILLAVSGGLDSVVLLHLFMQIHMNMQLSLAIIHVHHGLRGREADQDEIFVQELARKYGLPFLSIRVDVHQFSRKNRYSIEEAGRIQRFKFFMKIMAQLKFQKLALAHHADDRAETILMHLFRGTGLRGMSGILPKREEVIHPLLFATRQEIENWAAQFQLSFREDHSNKDRRYLRNRIRWDVLKPVKQTFHANVVQSICRAGDAVHEAEEWVHEGVRQALLHRVLFQKNHEFILDIHKFLNYFTSVQKGLIIYVIRQLRSDTFFVTNQEIESLMRLIHSARNNSVYEFSDLMKAVVSGQTVIFKKISVCEIKSYRIPFNQWISLPEYNGRIKIKSLIAHSSEPLFFDSPWIEYIDGSKLKYPFYIRSWTQGDRFQPLGMKGTKKLHDFFIDLKVPNHTRRRIPILTCHKKIVWIIGYRISEHCKLKPMTKDIVELKWEPHR